MINFGDIYGKSSNVLSVTLITVTHPTLGTIRLTDDNKAHTYEGQTYEPYYYKLNFPDESQSSSNTGSITFSNVSDKLIETVRVQPSGIYLRINAVYLQGGVYDSVMDMKFKLSNIAFGQTTISADLVLQTILNDNFPALTMTALNCPGVS